MEKEEYTIKSLFLPRLRGRPIREILAILMLNPIVWFLEASVWLLFAVMGVLQAKTVAPHFALWIILATTLAVTIFPIIYLLIMWLIDFYEREPLRFIFSLFMWGVASVFGSFIGEIILDGIFGIVISSLFDTKTSAFVNTIVGTVLLAPVVEEFMKGFGLIIIAGHHEMDDTFDGILYGFSVGVGFAAVENFLYFSVAFQEGHSTVLAFLTFVIYRSIICMIGHGCFTATTGMVIGFLKGRGKIARYAQVGGLIGLIGAMLLHGIFNASAIGQGIVQSAYFDWLQIPVPMFHGPLIIAMGFIYFIIIIFALFETRARVKREASYEEEKRKIN